MGRGGQALGKKERQALLIEIEKKSWNGIRGIRGILEWNPWNPGITEESAFFFWIPGKETVES